MQALNITTLALVIVGALNWGLVGLLNFDLVAALLGDGSFLARTVYVLVALSGLAQVRNLMPANAGARAHTG